MGSRDNKRYGDSRGHASTVILQGIKSIHGSEDMPRGFRNEGSDTSDSLIGRQLARSPHLANNQRDAGHPSFVWELALSNRQPGRSVDGGTYLVADVGAADPEDDIPGDVGGVVGNPFEGASDDDRIQGL